MITSSPACGIPPGFQKFGLLQEVPRPPAPPVHVRVIASAGWGQDAVMKTNDRERARQTFARSRGRATLVQGRSLVTAVPPKSVAIAAGAACFPDWRFLSAPSRKADVSSGTSGQYTSGLKQIL